MKQLITSTIILLLCTAGGLAQDDTQFSTTTKLSSEITRSFLSEGAGLLGFNTRFAGEFGKNKFDDDKVRKPSDIVLSYGFSYEHMISDKFAIGGFIDNAFAISRDKENDEKSVATALMVGPSMSMYKNCGKADNGGVFSSLSFGAGFHSNNYSFEDEKIKDPIGALIGGNLDLGGYYAPVDNLLLTASMGMLGFTTQWMPSESDFEPDMVNTDVKFGFKDANIKLGVKYILGDYDAR